MPGCAFCYTQNKHHPISSRMRKRGRDQSGTITQHLFWSSVASPPLICICPLRTCVAQFELHRWKYTTTVAGAPHEGCRSAGLEPVSQALGCTLRLSQHAAPRGVPRATVQPGLTKVTDRDLRLTTPSLTRDQGRKMEQEICLACTLIIDITLSTNLSHL